MQVVTPRSMHHHGRTTTTGMTDNWFITTALAATDKEIYR